MTVTFAEGDILDGKYRVERVLGQGAMGVVLGASRVDGRGATGSSGDDSKHRVAIKVLLHQHNHELVARFRREGKAALQLDSEHVGRVHDVGTLESGVPYLVMEWLDGEDLQQRLRRGRPSISEAVYRVLEACEAMAEAHSKGIVHRDLKPSNLFLARKSPADVPVLKVLDFGVSKQVDALGEPDAQLTKTQAMLGSPLYMAIEQMRSSRRVDARADVWSLGAILYELVTGGTPFDASNLPELMLKVGLEEPAVPSSRAGGVPPGLDAAILKCLEKKVENRFASVADLAEAIAPFGPPAGAELARRARASVGVTGPSLAAPPEDDDRELDDPDDEAATLAMESTAAMVEPAPDEPLPRPAPMPSVAQTQLSSSGSLSASGSLSVSRPSGTFEAPPSVASSVARPPAKSGARVFVVVASLAALAAVGVAIAMTVAREEPASRPAPHAPAPKVAAPPPAPEPTASVSAGPSASAPASAAPVEAAAAPSASPSASAHAPAPHPPAPPSGAPKPAAGARPNPLDMDIK